MSNFPVSLPPATPTDATMAAHDLDDMDGAGLDQAALLARLILDIAGLGTKVGIDGSADTDSFDYRMAALEASGPPGFFGDGSDGNVTITTTITLTRDMLYDTLTVNSGGILKTANFRVFCKTACIVNSGGIIQNDGVDATGNGGVAAVLAGTLDGRGGTGTGGGNGGAGSNANPVQIAADGSGGGAGGAGGAGSGGAGGTGGAANAVAATNGSFRQLPFAVLGYTLSGGGVGISVKGGAGGGGGGGGTGVQNGGGGGSGAGMMILVAKTIANNGTIRSKGGNGRAGIGTNCGGGGGGGGGLISLVYVSFSGNAASCPGGTGGTKTGTGVDGTNGSSGVIVQLTV